MFHPNFAVYLGSEGEEGFGGFIAENDFFAVLQVEGGLGKEEGRAILKKLVQDTTRHPIEKLADLESFLSEHFKEANLPAHFSFACGLLKENVILLKTTGSGEVYVQRGGNFTKLIEKENNASGYVKHGDILIFTTKKFFDVLGKEDVLKKALAEKKPSEVVETITPQMKSQEDKGVIALFILFEKTQEEEERIGATVPQETEPPVAPPPPPQAVFFQKFKETFSRALENTKGQLRTQNKKTVITLAVVIVIFVVFLWSVVLGYQRRAGAQKEKKIAVTKQLVTEKLNQAEEVAFLNLPRAIALINEAKADVADLKKDIGDKDNKEVAALEDLVREKEGKILKKEEKSYEEYFDLTLEDRNAKGSRIYADGENAAILNPAGAIYAFSLSKKSIDKTEGSEIKNADLVARYEDIIYFYKETSGIFRIDNEGKIKKVINRDGDWGTIADLAVYNGNIYLLDKGKSTVYKYVPTDDGFSAKSSYFKAGQGMNLSAATSLTIDLSVYISFPEAIVKYTGGDRDGFNPSFPEESVSVTKIMTNTDIEKVYAWDKGKGALYVVSKTGTYERQIKSSILQKASDIAVFEENAYILLGSKIYKMSLR